MAGIDLYDIQQDITAYVDGVVNWDVVTGGVPDATNVRYVDGVLEPYVVLRFTEGMPSARGNTFGGPRMDESYAYVDALCVAASDDEARALATFVNSKLLGRVFDNASALARNFGGGIYAVTSGNRLPEAYVAVTSYKFQYNLAGVGTSQYD
jgi:hypothetical protein